jgi:hypothetical protein
MEGIKYIQCDGSEEEQQICAQVGIESTPTTIIAGQGYHGAQSREVFAAAVQAPEMIAGHLKDMGATLFGRDSCIWTVRQLAIFGRHAESIAYVRCDADAAQAAQCSAAGLEGVPAWRLNGKVHMGYMRLDQLAEVTGMQSVRLDEQGAAAAQDNR